MYGEYETFGGIALTKAPAKVLASGQFIEYEKLSDTASQPSSSSTSTSADSVWLFGSFYRHLTEHRNRFYTAYNILQVVIFCMSLSFSDC